jgi:hypothetical protein
VTALKILAMAFLVVVQLTQADAAEFKKGKGEVWNATFSHDEVQRITKAADVVAMEVPSVPAAIIAGCSAGLKATDAYGGNNGVVVVGVAQNLTFITPPDDSPYGIMSQLDEAVLNGVNDQLGRIFHQIGNETDSMKREFDKLYGRLVGKPHATRPPSTEDIGSREAVSNSPNSNTEFSIVYLPSGRVGIATPKGWLQADGGGGKGKRARTKIRLMPGGWEEWQVESWSDGAVSFRTKDGNWRLGTSGKGELWADVPFEEGNLEKVAKFKLESGANGRVRLFSVSDETYVAVK